jgi:hypothetical protein
MRYEQERFRITTWPAAVETPAAVAVPGLAAVADTTWADEPEMGWLDLSLDGFETVGPLRSYPVSGQPFNHEGAIEKLYIDSSFRAEQPESEDGLIDAATECDDPPAVIFVARSRLVPLPDELFMREFLSIDTQDSSSILRFLQQFGPLVEPLATEHPDILEPVAGGWAEEATRLINGLVGRHGVDPEFDVQLEKAVEARDFEQMQGLHAKRDDERRSRATEAASKNPLQAELTEPWRSFTGMLEKLMHLPERQRTTGSGIEYPITTASGHHSVYVYGLFEQVALVRIYQALFESWLVIDRAVELEPGGLEKPPTDRLRDVWRRRSLPEPETRFEAITTMQLLLNAATSAAGPRVELLHPGLAPYGGAYGRPVPRVLTAMCLQVLAWLADGVPARRCANDNCGQWFSRQLGRATYGQYRSSGVIYCSKTCAKAVSQRNYRKRQRNAGADRGGRHPAVG